MINSSALANTVRNPGLSWQQAGSLSPLFTLARTLFLCVALLLVVTPAGAGGKEDKLAVGANKGMLRRVITYEGIAREYFVFVPDTTSAEGPLPVVLAIHGYTSTATGFEAKNGLNRHASDNGYIAVYPQGSHFTANDSSGSSYRITSWNDLAANQSPSHQGPHCTDDRSDYPCPPECGSCKQCDWTSCHDDLGFLSRVLDAVEAEFATDTSRYYALGVSNGAMMTLRLGCNLSERFAAIAPIIGQLAYGFECAPAVELPMLHLFGGKDDTVRFDGRPGADGFIYASAADTAAAWAAGIGCRQGPETWSNANTELGGLNCTSYRDCRVTDHEVVSCMDPSGRHSWPGQDVTGIPATCVSSLQYDSMPGQAHCGKAAGSYVHWGMDLIWDFMKRFRSTTTR